MKLNRNFTLAVHFVLDRLLPPILRDSRWFMAPIFYVLFGEKAKYYLAFKDELHHLSDQDINHYYELLADTFIHRETDLNRESIDYIRNNIKDESVLDVASGRGFMSEILAKQGYKVTGVDIIQPAGTDPSSNPVYVTAEITDLPFADNQFDTVVCTHTLEHIRDLPKALSEVRRVCKKKLIVVVPCQREYRYTFDLHIHFFPYEYNLRYFVKGHGTIFKAGGDFIYTEDFA
ncbi:MAG: ubiquinone/menaquinone biosynthesis C-methylase UbiE [Oleiphilaceae bacterium]|jgi:ubiquinone/menaquinone biosynthesis C-methylase UbiE